MTVTNPPFPSRGEVGHMAQRAAASEPATDSLGAAWAEAEAVVPEGWSLVHVMRPGLDETWGALAESDRGEYDHRVGRGPTPAAALRALAAALRERAK